VQPVETLFGRKKMAAARIEPPNCHFA